MERRRHNAPSGQAIGREVGAEESLWFYQAIVDAVVAGIDDENLARDLSEMLASVR